MSMLLILRGPPATGKSTYRNTLVAQGWKYTNLDELRLANPKNKESVIHDLQKTMLLGFMADGANIVIDNLNLNPRTTQGYESLAQRYGYMVEYKEFGADIHWSEAVKRDALRSGVARVGRSVIIQNYMSASLYKDVRKSAYIFDIDGTLADISHRRMQVVNGKKDWAAFNAGMKDDTPNAPIVNLYESLLDSIDRYSPTLTEIILMSGRSADHRRVTEDWLVKHGLDRYFALFMRGFNDMRDDAIVKKELYEKYVKPYFDVSFVVDDRSKVVSMWRSQGLTCLQCAEGNF